MRISVVSELLAREQRVGLTPTGVAELVHHGHDLAVERGAGGGAGFPDDEYAEAGAALVDATEAWDRAELLVKVKEPLEVEYPRLRPDLTLFTYLHLAADRPLTEALIGAGTLAIAYETVRDATGLPLLTPMSEIAGRLAAHAAAHHLQSTEGGPGVLLGGAPGIAPARVVVIGGGTVGVEAARLALGMGAEVTVLELSASRIRELDRLLDGRARVLRAAATVVRAEIAEADVVIGAVLVPGGAAPKVLRREDLGRLRRGALLIDVAIDQGGAFETSVPTTYDAPIAVVDGVRHYGVANMPGAVPRTATAALTNATLPYLRRLADLGPAAAIAADPGLAAGVNVRAGRIAHPGVATAFPDLPAETPARR